MHNRKSRTYPLAICAMLSAIILLLAFTPLGLIDLPLIKATILHVPVIIGAVLLGWRKGALLGGVFGLASLVKNTIAPSALSFAFSPFIPVPGTDRGSIWALVICLIPRILTGITPALVYAGVRRCFRKKNLGVNTGAAILAVIAGALTTTVLVMGLIFQGLRGAAGHLSGRRPGRDSGHRRRQRRAGGHRRRDPDPGHLRPPGQSPPAGRTININKYKHEPPPTLVQALGLHQRGGFQHSNAAS